MKKILIVPLILFFFVSSDLKATHYMGGEITWECTSYGNFRFIMKLYRECYLDSVNPAPNYGDSLSLMTTVPGFSSINMVRLQGYPIDISPVCNSNTWFPHIYCDTSNYPYWTNPNLGAVQEHIYTSDVAYPNGVPLTGVPPTNGWMFYFQGCCRNPSTNIINAANLSYRLSLKNS